MNGLEALENIKATYKVCDIQGNNIDPMQYEYSVIEQDLKVLNILKEKKVGLLFLDKTFDIYHLNNDELTRRYNALMRDEDNFLTEEEMSLIVDWLRRE